jgi:EpsI family protein
VAVLLIAAAALFLQFFGYTEVAPSRTPLPRFPLQLGPWAGTDDEIPKDVRDVLGPGDFLLRDYKAADQTQPPINLFIAYFSTQRTGDTIHSPLNCMPGAGWTPVDSTRITLSFPGHAPFPATRYIIAKGDLRELVLYWYWAHDRGVASEYWAKYHLVADSIRMNRSDGALVRISTLMSPGESAAAAEQRLRPFTANVGPLLGTYIPR